MAYLDPAIIAAIEAVIAYGDLETLAETLTQVRQLAGQLRGFDADLTAAIADTMHGQQEQAGPWRIERRKGSTRKGWDSEGVFGELIRLSNVVPETGEVRDPAEARDVLITAVRECVPLTKSLGWRAGMLRQWGIDPDEWAEVTPGVWRVEVTLDATANPGEVAP